MAVDRDLVCLILLQNRQRFEAARPSRPRSVKLNSAVVFSHRRRPCSPKVSGGSGELVVGAAGTRSDVHVDRSHPGTVLATEVNGIFRTGTGHAPPPLALHRRRPREALDHNQAAGVLALAGRAPGRKRPIAKRDLEEGLRRDEVGGRPARSILYERPADIPTDSSTKRKLFAVVRARAYQGWPTVVAALHLHATITAACRRTSSAAIQLACASCCRR